VKPVHQELYPDAPAYFQLALDFIGTHEILDGKLNPQVEAWLVNHTRFPVRLISKRTPWCAAFVSAMLEKGSLPSTHSAGAESYLGYGRACELSLYAIVVFNHHVGFVAGEAGDHVMVLSGNQSNQVCIKLYPKSSVLAYRMPV
jgi:uncharacterized protein (TIGR02594 family)